MISSQLITRQAVGNGNVAKAIDSYYQDDKDDYYTREKQPSEWYGELANTLGLQGAAVAKEDFAELLEGKFRGQILRDSSFRTDTSNERLGLDLTFNAPKSVSIQALVAGDSRLIQAHHEAVKESLAIFEKAAQARRKIGGKSRVEDTGKLAVAMFRHETNRNLDPHLHTHSIVLNLTQRQDGQYRALHNDKIMKCIAEASQAYQSNLAKKCRELGYNIRLNKNGTFDLAHISPDHIMQFSSRSKQIEAALKERGLDRTTATTEQKQVATFDTRQRKRSVDHQLMRQKWQKVASKLGLSKILLPSQEQIHERDSSAGNAYGDKQLLAKAAGETSAEKDSLYAMPSSDVAGAAEQRSQMLLQNNAQLELHQQRAATDRGLRWRSDGGSGIKSIVDTLKQKLGFTREKTMSMQSIPNLEQIRTLDDKAKFDHALHTQHESEKESLKDMVAYEPPSSDLTEKWKQAAADLNINLQGAIVGEEQEWTQDQLMQHVIDHAIDKKVELKHNELIKQILVKGMGQVTHNDAVAMIDKAVQTGDLVKATTLYQSAEGELRSAKDWVNIVAQDDITIDAAEKIVAESIKNGVLVAAEQKYITKIDIDREREILRIMQLGRNKKKAFYNDNVADELLSQSTLNDGQKSAAKLIMTTTDRVVGIQGYAGVGKSYTLAETLKYVENTGAKTHIFAPYGSQVKSLQADGHDAKTLARLLHSPKLQAAITSESLIVVDEAGVIANADMHKLLKIVRDKNAKLVLLGDTQQTKAVSAGKPFDVMQQKGLRMATIDEIQRQKDGVLKQAVVAAAKDQVDYSVQTLGKNVVEITDKTARLNTLVDRYIAMGDDERSKTLIVTGTNADKAYINVAVRQRLGLEGKGINVNQLKKIDMSAAELKHARYYDIGMIVEVEQSKKEDELQKGQIYEVVGKDRHLLSVRDTVGKIINVNPLSTKLAAYKEQSFEVTKGDKLRISKGDVEKGTTTGDQFVVKKLGKNYFIAQDEKTGHEVKFSTKDKHHFDYNYCSTIHSSQGLTVDNVLINIDTTSKTTSKELYYVAVSRARYNAFVVTDSMEKLPSAISQRAEKHSATDMLANKTVQHKSKNNMHIKNVEKGTEYILH